jgi:CBS domain-containing protein
MDGGRVFRAIVWAVTGYLMKATRWASNMGRYFGWALMVLGVLNLFRGGGIAGVWWILIGWFISSLAAMSYKQLISDRALGDLKISDLMRTEFDYVRAEVTLPEFIEQKLLRSAQKLWPVIENDQLIGFISLHDVINLSALERSEKSTKDMMRPLASIIYLAPNSNARDAFRLLASTDEPLPVVRQDEMVGLVQRGDILKWMSFHEISS